jgi:hypothetical protein
MNYTITITITLRERTGTSLHKLLSKAGTKDTVHMQVVWDTVPTISGVCCVLRSLAVVGGAVCKLIFLLDVFRKTKCDRDPADTRNTNDQ